MKACIYLTLALVLASINNTLGIYNGRPVTDNTFYALARIGTYWGPEWGYYICTGALITNDIVVTAAHCFVDYSTGSLVQPSAAYVYLGSPVLLGSDQMIVNVTTISEETLVTHANYNSTGFNNDDIALLKIPINQMTRPILPISIFANQLKNGDVLDVAGWGSIYNNQTYPRNAQWNTFELIDIFECATAFNFTMTPGIMCLKNQNSSICVGDSGAGAQFNGELAGIAIMTSEEGCDKGFPMGFLNLAHYRRWIRSSLNKL